ncbi:MAG: hypothetical protein ACJ78Q_00790 [Chloroflexia bacterium]
MRPEPGGTDLQDQEGPGEWRQRIAEADNLAEPSITCYLDHILTFAIL